MDTIEEWIETVEGYAEEAPRMPKTRLRLLRASLDGAWRRLHSRDAEGSMRKAVEQANQRLPERLQLGFFDPVTGKGIGQGKGVQYPPPSSV